MVEPGHAQLFDAEKPTERRMSERVDVVAELVEARVDDHIRESVVDEIDLDTSFGSRHEGLFELLPDGVGLPDISLKVDAIVRLLNGCQHVVVHVAAVGVHLDRRFTRGDFL